MFMFATLLERLRLLYTPTYMHSEPSIAYRAGVSLTVEVCSLARCTVHVDTKSRSLCAVYTRLTPYLAVTVARE